jgi:hypothetical protein
VRNDGKGWETSGGGGGGVRVGERDREALEMPGWRVRSGVQPMHSATGSWARGLIRTGGRRGQEECGEEVESAYRAHLRMA